MRSRSAAATVVLVWVLAITVPVMAHHSADHFDLSKEVTLKGTVVEWVWANPHSFLTFQVKDEQGTVTTWVAETQHPQDIMPRGFRRTSFKAGDMVTVAVSPAKDGGPMGRIRSVLLADGTRLPIERAQ